MRTLQLLLLFTLALPLTQCGGGGEECPPGECCEADPCLCPGAQCSQGAVSDCGGFPGWVLWPDVSDYCGAERLHWQHDPALGVLHLAHSRVLLNCCGAHSISAVLEAGVARVRELDEVGEGRCRCECVYDFAVELAGVTGGTLPLWLTLDVADMEPTLLREYQGDLDLAAGSGVIVLDPDPTAFCP